MVAILRGSSEPAFIHACSHLVRSGREQFIAGGGIIARIAAVAGKAVQQLADELFQYNGALGQYETVAILHEVGGAARFDADILAAQQAAGEDGGTRI